MAIRQSMNNHHWNYFLMLDAEAAEISRFIEFTEDNYSTYSLELARLLMSASAEVDVVAKLACAYIAPQSNPRNIVDYQRILTGGRPNLAKYPIQIRRFGLKFKPWTAWSSRQTPKWWTACNDVKHHRNLKFPSASLKHALNAVAGLHVMLLYAFPDGAQNGTLHPRPQLFSVQESFVNGYGPIEDGTPVQYKL